VLDDYGLAPYDDAAGTLQLRIAHGVVVMFVPIGGFG